ncbi:hypothetical protein K443DRAFT_440542 [Laccaria amethystina LaAM-08-1]|uniref:Unplaced genomic scaffold K443scaffold_389, whole genome shotgun sequence n=1 Tax=Laccaria amethystina LaAM-08-1 TaxID=1095629 RepID=A0A0C9X3K2_9AGAR|nr:hypothetical protein K443DRAFT_440542 [Laccaria amethystina LaAM-08-1]
MPKYLAPSERSLPREFVRSPYFPSAPEAAVILESIREAQLEIDVLSQNISDLQEAIKRLEAQRARAETYTRFQQSLLAPIRKLPSEVLAEIFLHCIPRIVIEGAVKNRPMQLAGVSGYWRHIIQNLQVFWSSFPHILQRTPLVRQEFPALRSLRMHSHTRMMNVIDAFELAPQLTQLYLGGFGFESIMNSLKLPWAQITHFKSYMNRIWLENIRDVFDAMPNLEKFESI